MPKIHNKDNGPNAGYRICPSCQQEFWSSDKIAIHMCDPCKKRGHPPTDWAGQERTKVRRKRSLRSMREAEMDALCAAVEMAQEGV